MPLTPDMRRSIDQIRDYLFGGGYPDPVSNAEQLAAAVKANKSLQDVKKFDDYRSSISAEVMKSGQFAFKAFLIQVANHQAEDVLPIQFVHYDTLTADQKAEVEKFAALVKYKGGSIVNAGLLKPGEVVKAVQAGLGNAKVERNGKQVDKFNSDTHTRCWSAVCSPASWRRQEAG